MAEVSFSLIKLYEKYFGETPATFDPKFNPVPVKQLQGQKGNGSPYYGVDALGRLYFMPVTVKYTLSTLAGASNVTIQSGSVGGTTTVADTFDELKSYDLPFPVVSVASKKMIIETPLTERVGTVKELISIEDFEITIRGLIINQTKESIDFPEADVAQMVEIFRVGAAIQIASPLTDIFLIHPDRKGTDNVVVRSFELLPIKGVQTVRPYEMRLVSDAPFNLNQIS